MKADLRLDSFMGLAAKWTGAPCTLNSQPARIMGRLYHVALVCAIDKSAGELECSWHEVNQMMLLAKGNFFGKAGVN
jgi:hypothetical protein